MEYPVCQSCGMPMSSHDQFGTEKNGSPSADYCVYCYKGGAFTADLTMEQMIEHNLKYLDDYNKDSQVKFSKEEAHSELLKYLPMLKRWVK